MSYMLQTVDTLSTWPGYFGVETFFVTVFTTELGLRIVCAPSAMVLIRVRHLAVIIARCPLRGCLRAVLTSLSCRLRAGIPGPHGLGGRH